MEQRISACSGHSDRGQLQVASGVTSGSGGRGPGALANYDKIREKGVCPADIETPSQKQKMFFSTTLPLKKKCFTNASKTNAKSHGRCTHPR
jgi:hypothetical protein